MNSSASSLSFEWTQERSDPKKNIEICFCIVLLNLVTDELLPVDLPVLVEVLQAFKHVLQHSGDSGLVQNAGLVLPSGDDVFDHVQHGAWIATTRNGHLVIRNKARSPALLETCISARQHQCQTNENSTETVPAALIFAPNC